MNIVTAKELSAIFKVSDSTIYNLVMRKQLPGFRIGGSWRFDLDKIKKGIEKSLKVGNPDKG